MDWGRLFFSAYGRIRRQDFWMAFLVLFGAALLVGWIFPLMFVILYCSICIRSKRLHDMGRSGWLQLIPWVGYTVAFFFTIYAVVGTVVAGINFNDLNEMLTVTGMVFGWVTVGFAWVIACFIDLGFLAWIGFFEGERYENRFGEPPVRPESTYVARA